MATGAQAVKSRSTSDTATTEETARKIPMESPTIASSLEVIRPSRRPEDPLTRLGTGGARSPGDPGEPLQGMGPEEFALPRLSRRMCQLACGHQGLERRHVIALAMAGLRARRLAVRRHALPAPFSSRRLRWRRPGRQVASENGRRIQSLSPPVTAKGRTWTERTADEATARLLSAREPGRCSSRSWSCSLLRARDSSR